MIRGVAPFEQHRCTLSSFSADVILYKLGFFNSFASSMQGFRIFVVLVVCPWIFLCLLGFFYHFVASPLQCRVSLFLWSCLVVCPWIFLYLLGGFSFIFFRFFNAGLPDFRLPRAAEQGGAPRLPAEEAAAAGACAPAPANGASPGLERMLTEMQIDVPLGGEGRHGRKG